MKYAITIAALFFLAACGSSEKEKNVSLADKKAELQKLKDQAGKLETEIAKLDTAAAKAEKAKLVAVTTLAPGEFKHYIDLQGKVDAVNNAYVTPRNGGGQVKEVLVKQGDRVRKGQLLLKLDDAILRKQMDQLQSQLAYAKDLYQRQQNLWNQNIGTEVQLLNAKNNVDNLEKQMASLKEQLSFTNVYAEMSGIADPVNVRPGEFFQGIVGGQMVQIGIVNTSAMKIVTQIPENYLGKVNVGCRLEVELPDIHKTLAATVNVASPLIEASSRSFRVEAKIPSQAGIHPNQLAKVRIQDYAAKNVITVPMNTLQNDEKGKYVLVAATENGKMHARKRPVEIGELYGDKLEIKGGLKTGDVLITEGFQELYDGQLITTDVK